MQQGTDLPLELFPERIHQLRLEVLAIEKELDQLKAIRAERKNTLKSTEWQAMGSNDKIRDANFELALSKDTVYRTANQDIEKIEWDLREAQYNVEKHESMFSVKKLRLREYIANTELQAATGLKPMTVTAPATAQPIAEIEQPVPVKSKFPF